jgi:protoheme IX farnesyltransferase
MNALFWILYTGTIFLLLVGAQLQVLKAALVCPDWPLCYGEFLPQYMGPGFYESLHRFLAALIGLGSVAWALLRWKRVGILAGLPLFLIVLQSLLGLATFWYKLPTVTTVLHLIFSLIFLASLEGTKDLKVQSELRESWNPKWKDAVGLFLVLFLVQFILGGILRKSSLLAQCESTMEFWQCWKLQSSIPLAGNLSLMHRALGLLTTFTGLFVFIYLLKSLPKWKHLSFSGLLLMTAQLLLGLQMGRSASRGMIIWHFTVALFLFLILLNLLVRLRRHEVFFFQKPLPTYVNDVLDLFKPKLTALVVVTLLVGVFLAPLDMNLIFLFLALIGIWLQAAGSLALNCYLEREADKLMERTKDRPLPAGRLAPVVALKWGWGFLILGSIIVFLTANALTAALGIFSALSYLYVYTPMKMKTPYALYVGAVPGALPTLMGWTTVTNQIGGPGLYLFGILFLWQIPHFMAISLYRKEEYGSAHFLTFAQTHSFPFLRLNIFLYSLLLLAFAFIPYFSGWREESYLYSSMLVSVILLGFAGAGYLVKNDSQARSWARSYFFATLFYLPLVLGLLLVLR